MYKLQTPVLRLRLLFNIFIATSVVAIIYYTFLVNHPRRIVIKKDAINLFTIKKLQQDYNVWLIFTKVSKRSPLTYKFSNLLENMLNISTVPLKFHIIVDNSSRELAVGKIGDVVTASNKIIDFKLYDVETCAKAISDIVQVMMPHFSSKPGTYYSDALFYISLGLYLIAPATQTRAVLLDCDLYFKQDVKLLFDEFDSFKPTALYGLAPELTPVYRHVLQRYKSTHHNTTFGEYYHPNATLALGAHPRGFQGYNSGVVLIHLSAIRKSKEYFNVIKNETVQSLSSKYNFRGHLGDQDFYTLVGFEYPHLIQTLNCGFNRQLCVWWRDHGYKDVFNYYFKCRDPTVILHGNCNTRIPK